MRKKILVADDEDDLRQVIKDMFKGLDYEMVFVRNGEEALRKLSKLKLDLAILDLAMPKRSGLEVCSFMKDDPILMHVPIIILSAYTRDKQGEKASLANRYIHKPFQHDDLLDAVAQLLK